MPTFDIMVDRSTSLDFLPNNDTSRRFQPIIRPECPQFFPCRLITVITIAIIVYPSLMQESAVAKHHRQLKKSIIVFRLCTAKKSDDFKLAKTILKGNGANSSRKTAEHRIQCTRAHSTSHDKQKTKLPFWSHKLSTSIHGIDCLQRFNARIT